MGALSGCSNAPESQNRGELPPGYTQTTDENGNVVVVDPAGNVVPAAGTGNTAGGGPSTAAGAGTVTSGSGGTSPVAGTGGTAATGEPMPGVVVVDEAGTASCAPLCVENTDPAADPEGDDWSFENGQSCVIPNTVTGQNQMCTTGQPLPPAESVPGVVVVDNDAGTTSCIPLCTINTDPAADPEGDDWSYENNASCVIPGTVTGQNQPCMTGEPIPEPLSVPGVVVVDNDVARCAPLCTITTDISQDDDGDGWSYENNDSCVIPGTTTASNQSCMTGEPLPGAEERPGILVNTDDDLDAECVALCQVATEPSNPDNPDAADWGYENNDSCVLPGSPTAQGTRECTYNGAPPSYVPPALTGNKVADGFYTQAGVLYDAYGSPFVIRGVNNAHIYFDTSARFLAWEALDNIKSYGTNTIRVVWQTEGPATLLADILFRIVELGMVPMVEMHDATGSQDEAALLDMAGYYAEPDVKQVLLDFREYLLVNIANEWSGQGNYASAYQNAIGLLRDNGIEHTLVIDASGFGQDAQSIFSNAESLMAADPENNLLFSVHMYGQYSDPSQVQSVLNQAADSGIPLIVGEFAQTQQGSTVAWQSILDTAQSLGLGYIGWSWLGNEDTALDMALDWEGPLTSWGEAFFNGTNGISATSKPASIFN